MKHLFLVLIIFIVAGCAPKDEEIVPLEGTYRALQSASTAKILCWTTALVRSGDNVPSNVTQTLTLVSGEYFQLEFSGRNFQLEFSGVDTNNNCTATGTYLINNRFGSDIGTLTFLTTSSTCTSSKTSTIKPTSATSDTSNPIALPLAISSSNSYENDFSIESDGSELRIKLPFDFAINDADLDGTCQAGECTCFFVMGAI